MNAKHRKGCVIYDIATGKSIEAPNITRAAVIIGYSKSNTTRAVNSSMHIGDWVVAFADDEEKAVVKLRSLQNLGYYARADRRTKHNQLVPMRIDARTVIYVKPEEATEAFAEQWKERYKK